MYGSTRQVLTGLMRALPDPGSAGPRRAAQIARRLPRMVREQRPHLTASCEVAGMLADGLGLPGAVQEALTAYLLERWDGHGPLGRAKGDEIPLPMRIVPLAVDAAFQRMLGGEERVVQLTRERAGHAFDPDVAACLVDHASEILAAGEQPSVWEETLACEPGPPRSLEGEALERGLAAMGNFADLISPYSGRSLHRCGGACRRGGVAVRDRRSGRRAAPARGAGPRRGEGGGQRTDLAEARTAERRRMGAGETSSLPLRACPGPLGVPVGARAGGRSAPRAHRRIRLPPRGRRRRTGTPGAAARGRRCVPRDDRATAVPGADPKRAGSGDPGRGGPRRDDSTPTRLPRWWRRRASERPGSSAPLG